MSVDYHLSAEWQSRTLVSDYRFVFEISKPLIGWEAMGEIDPVFKDVLWHDFRVSENDKMGIRSMKTWLESGNWQGGAYTSAGGGKLAPKGGHMNLSIAKAMRKIGIGSVPAGMVRRKITLPLRPDNCLQKNSIEWPCEYLKFGDNNIRIVLFSVSPTFFFACVLIRCVLCINSLKKNQELKRMEPHLQIPLSKVHPSTQYYLHPFPKCPLPNHFRQVEETLSQ